MRKKIVAGNWKMNLDKLSSKNLVLEILEKTENNDTNIIISPPFIYLEDTVKDCLRRDLTFNALYMDSSQKVYDFNNGLEHLENSKIIFIGNFKKKCLEDNLRIIRFIRFCSLFKSPVYPGEYMSFF